MQHHETMKTAKGLAITLALSMQLHIGAVVADGHINPPIDISKWLCKDCPFEEGYSGMAEGGLGTVSEDSFKFGEYNGLNDGRGWLIGNALVRFRGDDARYLDLSVSDLGLNSRSINVDYGVQGHYDLWLNYDQIPHYISDSARTPFLGTGGDVLSLPGGWVRAGNTGTMTSLSASLREVELETERKRLEIGGSLLPDSRWKYSVNFRHEAKDGMRGNAGAFFFNGTQLVMPVDYVTNDIEVSAAYNGEKEQLRVSYFGSQFSNRDESLTWDNPYSSFVAGADRGQLALPPDNQFHQIMLSAGYQFTDRTHAAGDIAVGRMTQNESFLPTTLTAAPWPLPSAGVPTLPRSSLDGQVNTVNADIKLVTAVTDKLRLNAVFAHDKRDNKTPQAAYTWVTTDSFTNPDTRTNLPYSFTRNTYKLGADFRVVEGFRFAGGLDYETHERDYQEVTETNEATLWAKASYRAIQYVNFSVKGTHAIRDASSYNVVPEIDGPENPLLRKYNMADRRRDSVGLRADVTPHERVTLGVGVDFARNDYTDSPIGLIESDELNLTGDASVLLGEKTTVNVYVVQERIESKQANSGIFATPDWFANNKDRITTAGLNVSHNLIEDKLDVGMDFVVARSKGDIDISPAAAAFPALVTKLNSLKLHTTYQLKEHISVTAAYWHERYSSRDWTMDDIAPDTIDTVLTFGEVTPSYRVNAVGLTVRYEF